MSYHDLRRSPSYFLLYKSCLPSKPTSHVKFSKPFCIPAKILVSLVSEDLYTLYYPKPVTGRARAEPGGHTTWFGSFHRQGDLSPREDEWLVFWFTFISRTYLDKFFKM